VSAANQTDLPMARLLRDINSSETMLDLVALRLKRSGVSLPGHERGRDWFDTAIRNGLPDEHFTQGLHDRHWYYTEKLPAESLNDWIGPFMTKTQAIQHSMGIKEVIHD
jgi:hypothetical protein